MSVVAEQNNHVNSSSPAVPHGCYVIMLLTDCNLSARSLLTPSESPLEAKESAMCLTNSTVADKPVRHNLEAISCSIVSISSNPALFRERFQKIADSVDSRFDVEVKITQEFSVAMGLPIPNGGACFVLSFKSEMGGSPHVGIGEFFKQMEAI
jgi:hypothetical protein